MSISLLILPCWRWSKCPSICGLVSSGRCVWSLHRVWSKTDDRAATTSNIIYATVCLSEHQLPIDGTLLTPTMRYFDLSPIFRTCRYL